MIILDTDILTHFSHGKVEVQKHWDAVLKANPDEQLVVTVVTWCEAIRGRTESVLKAADASGVAQAEELLWMTLEVLNDFEVLPFDDAAGKQFEKLQKQKKLKMDRGDMLIASIALAQNATLATGNIKHYKDVVGLKIEDWTH
jgi:tRNA(fMet)-specific endonuclease VapC